MSDDQSAYSSQAEDEHPAFPRPKKSDVEDGLQFKNLLDVRMRDIMRKSLPIYVASSGEKNRSKAMEDTWREVWEVNHKDWDWEMSSDLKERERNKVWRLERNVYINTRKAFDYWYKHYGAQRKRKDDDHGKSSKSWSNRDVFTRLYNEELHAIIATSSDDKVEPGSKDYMKVFQSAITTGINALPINQQKELKAIAAEWTTQGPPMPVRREEAKKHLIPFIDSHLEEAGVRFAASILSIAVYDIGNGPVYEIIDKSRDLGFTEKPFLENSQDSILADELAGRYYAHVTGQDNPRDYRGTWEPTIERKKKKRSTRLDPSYEFQIKDGLVVLPDGPRFYKNLFEPESDYRAELRKYVRQLINAAHSVITSIKYLPCPCGNLVTEDGMRKMIHEDSIPYHVDGSILIIGDPHKRSVYELERLCDYWSEHPLKFIRWGPNRSKGSLQAPVPFGSRWWNLPEDEQHGSNARARRDGGEDKSDSSDGSSETESVDPAEDPSLVRPDLMSEKYRECDWPGVPPLKVAEDPLSRMGYLKALAGDNVLFSEVLLLAYSTMEYSGSTVEYAHPDLPINWTSERCWFERNDYKFSSKMKELLSKLLDKPWASPDSEREMSQAASSYRGLAAWPYREQWLLNTAVAYKDVASQKAVNYEVQHNYVMSWKKYLRNVNGTLSVEELEFAWSAFRDALVTKAKPRRAMHLPPLMVAIGDRRTYLESIVNETAFLKTAKVVFKLEKIRMRARDDLSRTPSPTPSVWDGGERSGKPDEWCGWETRRVGIADCYHEDEGKLRELRAWLKSSPWISDVGPYADPGGETLVLLRSSLVYSDLTLVQSGALAHSCWKKHSSGIRTDLTKLWINLRKHAEKALISCAPAKTGPRSHRLVVPADIDLEAPGTRARDADLRADDPPVKILTERMQKSLNIVPEELARSNREMKKSGQAKIQAELRIQELREKRAKNAPGKAAPKNAHELLLASRNALASTLTSPEPNDDGEFAGSDAAGRASSDEEFGIYGQDVGKLGNLLNSGFGDSVTSGSTSERLFNTPPPSSIAASSTSDTLGRIAAPSDSDTEGRNSDNGEFGKYDRSVAGKLNNLINFGGSVKSDSRFSTPPTSVTSRTSRSSRSLTPTINESPQCSPAEAPTRKVKYDANTARRVFDRESGVEARSVPRDELRNHELRNVEEVFRYGPPSRKKKGLAHTPQDASRAAKSTIRRETARDSQAKPDKMQSSQTVIVGRSKSPRKERKTLGEYQEEAEEEASPRKSARVVKPSWKARSALE